MPDWFSALMIFWLHLFILDWEFLLMRLYWEDCIYFFSLFVFLESFQLHMPEFIFELYLMLWQRLMMSLIAADIYDGDDSHLRYDSSSSVTIRWVTDIDREYVPFFLIQEYRLLISLFITFFFFSHFFYLFDVEMLRASAFISTPVATPLTWLPDTDWMIHNDRPTPTHLHLLHLHLISSLTSEMPSWSPSSFLLLLDT